MKLTPSAAAVGTVSAREWRFKFSGIYRADTEKLRGVFRKVFVGG